MIPYRRFMDAVFAEPFRPFRVHTTAGRTFELRYPESVCLGRTKLTISVPRDDDPDSPGPWQHISLESINAIEPL
jgi:hypothetical protein